MDPDMDPAPAKTKLLVGLSGRWYRALHVPMLL